MSSTIGSSRSPVSAVVLVATAVIMTLTVEASAGQSFVFSVKAPDRIEGRPGGTVSFDAEVILTSANDDLSVIEGCQGWSFSLECVGGKITAIEQGSLLVPVLVDDDRKPSTPLVASTVSLDDTGFSQAELAYIPGEPDRNGVISAIVLSFLEKRVLFPSGEVTIARISVEADVPSSEGACRDLTLRFQDGFRGSGRPVKNVATFDGESVDPALESSVTALCAKPYGFGYIAFPAGLTATEEPDGSLLARKAMKVGSRGEFDVEVRIESSTGRVDGIQGWSLGLLHDESLEVVSIDLEIDVGTLVDADRTPSTPLTASSLNLAEAGFAMASEGADRSGRAGVISALVLDLEQYRVLPGESLVPVLRIRYRTVEPVAAGENPPCRISFADGILALAQPVVNVVTIDGTSRRPGTFRDLTVIPVGRDAVPFIRGDVNDDGRVDIADVVSIVGAVVPGLGGRPIQCLGSGDTNADAKLNLGDAMYLILWQFQAGPKPTAPFPICGFDPSSPDLCPAGTVPACENGGR